MMEVLTNSPVVIMHQIIILYTLNLYNVISQLYLNKAGKLNRLISSCFSMTI